MTFCLGSRYIENLLYAIHMCEKNKTVMSNIYSLRVAQDQCNAMKVQLADLHVYVVPPGLGI